MEKVIVEVRSKRKLNFNSDSDVIRGVQYFYEDKADDPNIIGPMVKKAFIACDNDEQLRQTFEGMCRTIPGKYELVLKPVSTSKGYDLKVVGFADLPAK